VIEKAREAMRKKMDELGPTEAQAPPPPVANPVTTSTPKPNPPPVVVVPPPPPPKPKPSPPSSLPPIEGPALPISAEQQQRLSALLARYKADEITPDQYQTERAKILHGN
jgi:hypothetical protein